MKNNLIKEKYHFSDFTTENYRYLIQQAKINYRFSSYDTFDASSKFVLLRHDIDLSPQRALHLATIENEEGVSATYFWYIHSEYYNLFEKEIFNIVKKISALGHSFGIHFDSHFYNIQTQKQIEECLLKEKDILEKVFDLEIKVFSFHNTNPFIMSCKNWEYAGLINTYADYFQNEVTYCSDSNGYWRFQRMADTVEKAESSCLQLLTHPVWWQKEVMSPWQRIQRCINSRAENNKNNYCRYLKSAGMKNIDWEGEI